MSPNPSVLQRKNEQPQNLLKDDVFQLQGGDIVSLLSGKFSIDNDTFLQPISNSISGKYTFTVYIEDDTDSKEMEEGFSEDATQVDLEVRKFFSPFCFLLQFPFYSNFIAGN